MLSRVADALFWMSRYLERAEHTARLVDVCFHLELDLHGVLSGPHELHWTALMSILRPSIPLKANGVAGHSAISDLLTFDLGNAESIMSCVTQSRYNARSVRGTINSEMWKELNKLYWLLCDDEFCSQARESPHDFYQSVESGSHMFQGVCDATMTHNEGWQFIRLGKFLERADKTLRILDIQYHLLQSMLDPADVPLSNLQWASVLRSCRAYEAYQSLYVGRVDPDHVVEFLLLHPTFPRSVRFCLESAATALAEIELQVPGRGTSPADRILGRVLNDLKYLEVDQILHSDLHVFLGSALERCAAASRAVQEQYSLQ
jgi:uncharacterized alpha-E superfamily protein